MLLTEQDGIRCDRCHKAYKQDFTYYSYDYQEISVMNGMLPQFNYNAQPMFSMDICTSCMDDIATIVKEKHKPTDMKEGRRCPKGIFCDLTGNVMKGTFQFILCVISKVQVQLSGRKPVCNKCKQHIEKPESPCPKRSGTEFTKLADTLVEDRFLELWLSYEAYEQLKERAIELRKNPEASKWSTTAK